MKCSRGFSTLLELVVIAVGILGGVYVYLHKSAPGVGTDSPTATSTNRIVSPTGTYEIRTKVFGLSTTSLPYITNYNDASVMKSINSQIQTMAENADCGNTEDFIPELEERGYSQKEIAKMTSSEMMDTLGWYSSTQVNDIFFDKGIFSFSYTYDNNCGGPYPSADSRGITYDLGTGKEATLADQFYMYSINQNAIVAILSKNYDKEDRKEQAEDSTLPFDNHCEGVMTSSDPGELYVSFYISHGELFVVPDLPHVIAACTLAVPVPVSELKPYLSSSSLLLRL